MSQAGPLSKLLPQYNAAVENMHRWMQQDNVKHMDAMLSAYGTALEGGASDDHLGHLEKKMANRDNFNKHRRKKDIHNWMAVDKKVHSYLGRDMNVLVGGQHVNLALSLDKEPQLVQSLRVLSAFIDDLSKRLVQSRAATLKELQEAVNLLVNDVSLSQDAKHMLLSIKHVAESEHATSMDLLIKNMAMLASATMDSLAPFTSHCVMNCGIGKHLRDLPEAEDMPLDPMEKMPLGLQGGCGEDWLQGGEGCGVSAMGHKVGHHNKSLEGGKKKVVDDEEWLSAVSNSWLAAGSTKTPKFRSPAAAQLYNLISAAQ